MNADVAIVGGGIMGSALAYWLTRLDPNASVVVIERDPSYSTASSALSAASIRQQFTTPVNIRISQASIGFMRQADELLEVPGSCVDIGLKEQGYLYLARTSGLASLRRANTIQRELGSDVALLSTNELAVRFPWLQTGDLLAGSLGLSGEGWFDGYALLMAFTAKARSQGVKYLRGEVAGMAARSGRIESLRLADGTQVASRFVVNAAGPWARSVAKLAGFDLPVVARRRTVYVIACRTKLEPFPLLIDPSGFWIRPEGLGFIAGITPNIDPDDAPLEPDYDAFDSVLWPALAQRIPAFEAAKLERAWAGYYEMNLFDHNGIVGFHPAIANLLLLNGFSGHGIQQAPVVSRGVAELICHGRFVTLDLSDLAYNRIAENRPLHELNVI
ncbi:MAG: FAD-dependent oxidoreductase protein 1 [Gammaproteobacteria bacterium]|nr:FAD-dependent oxidoreductase protein 1 [Gammaproteobacteria bacterium]